MYQIYASSISLTDSCFSSSGSVIFFLALMKPAMCIRPRFKLRPFNLLFAYFKSETSYTFISLVKPKSASLMFRCISCGNFQTVCITHSG